MQASARIAKLAVQVLVTGALLSSPAYSQSSCCRIAGKVVGSATGSPLAQTRVVLAAVDNRQNSISVVTGDDGSFAFSNLPPGKYSLSAARRGYIDSYFNQHDNFSTAIVTGPGEDSEHLIFRLTPQAILSGRILDELGEPVRRARVTLYRQDRGNGRGLIHRVHTAQTDDRGTYEFDGLASGDYFLSADATPWYAVRPMSNVDGSGATSPPPSNQTLDVAYSTMYYTDAADPDEATPIPLRGGERLAADIHLSPVPALRLVINTGTSPEQGFVFPQLLRKSFDSMENVTNTLLQTQAGGGGGNMMNTLRPGQGKVELVGIPAGKYTVYVPNAAEGSDEGTMADVDLTRDGQEFNPASADPVSTLNFKVHVAGSKSIPGQLMLALQTPEYRIAVGSGVDPDGNASFTHIPPGKYNLLAASPTTDYSVMSITSNSATTTGHALEVTPGEKLEANVTLIHGTATVQGFARRNGKGVAGAMIVLVPKDPETNSDRFRRDQSDSDGSFSLPNVVAGDYTVIAIDDGWDLNWSDPGVLAHYLPGGRAIVVRDGTLQLPEDIVVQPK